MDAVEFLEFWFDPGDIIEFRPVETFTDPTTGKKHARPVHRLRTWHQIGIQGPAGWQHFRPRTEAFLKEHVAACEAERANVFFGVCPRPGGNGQFDLSHQQRKINGYYSDVDDCPPDEVVKRALVGGLPIISVVVSTGHGGHAYWRFPQAVCITDAGEPAPIYTEWLDQPGSAKKKSRKYLLSGGEKVYLTPRTKPHNSPQADHAEDVLKGIAQLVGGDHTTDLARVLRLPDTWNLKNVRHGAEPTRCTVAMAESLRAPPEAFEFCKVAESLTARLEHVPLPAERKSIPPKGRDLLAQLIYRSSTADDRSDADYNLCATAIERGWPREQVWAAVADVGKFGDRGLEYFDLTWEKAARKTKEKIYERLEGAQAAKGERKQRAAAGAQPGATGFEGAEQLCEALAIDVLGELDEEGRVRIFSKAYRKTDTIRDVSKLSLHRLVQLCGPLVTARVADGKEDIPGLYSLSDVKRAIAALAGRRRLMDEREAGRGVWPGKTHSGEETGTVVLVGAGEAARLNGEGGLTKVLVPRVDGLLLDLSSSEPWYDFEQLNAYVLRARNDRQWAIDCVLETHNLFARWAWSHDVPGQKLSLDAMVVAGLTLCTWVQTLWAWRPLVSVIGASNSGKTTLFETLGHLFGSLALRSSRSSEAGIRQQVRHHALAILCDEFERSYHRERILELFRTTSRGDKLLRGTAHHKGEVHGLQHIPWVAAIEVNLTREPDRNRFIGLELKIPPPELRGKLDPGTAEQLADLGQRLLAVAIVVSQSAVTLARALKAHRVAGVDDRVIESYAVPAAMLAAVEGHDLERAKTTLERLLRGVERSEQGQTDEKQCLEDLLAAWVDCGRGERHPVSAILANIELLSRFKDALEAHGITTATGDLGRPVDGSSPRWLFVAGKLAASKLLKGTDWEGQDINKILSRLEGARLARRRLAGRNDRGLDIPMELVKKWVENA